LRSLYCSPSSATLPCSARSLRDHVAEAIAAVAGGVRRGLQSPESARGVASVCDRLAERQPAQVHGSDVGAPQRSRDLSSLPAFHHACAVGSRDALETAARARPGAHRGADSRRDEFPETRFGLGGRGPTVLRRARQSCQLPDGSHGCVVDRGAGLAVGCDVVSARGVAHAVPADAGTDSRDGAIRAEMATGLDAVPPGARGRIHDHGRGRRCRVRRQRHAAPHLASRQAALRVGGVVRSHGVPGDARARTATAADGHRTSAHPPLLVARHAHRRGTRVGGDTPVASGDSSRGAMARIARGGPASVPSA
jgi:hypothetical protein